jgi:hypothetical protein
MLILRYGPGSNFEIHLARPLVNYMEIGYTLSKPWRILGDPLFFGHYMFSELVSSFVFRAT